MARERKPKGGGNWPWAAGLLVAFAVLALTSWVVPTKTVALAETDEARLERGPASYFHHFYDPDGLLGPVGNIDLALDNFERETSHAIIVAAFASVPGDDPDFTMRVAERWRPGVKGANNGVILFVFTRERRIRAEVGYGLEAELPDAEVAAILDEAVVPAFRTGDFAAGLDAAVQRICARARAVPSGERPARFSPWTVLRNGVRAVPHAARAAVAAALAASFGMRLVLSLFAVVLGGIAVMLIGNVVQEVRSVIRVARTERDLEGAEKAAGIVLALAAKVSYVVLFFFLLAVGGTFVFTGSGQFGGGGVERLW